MVVGDPSGSTLVYFPPGYLDSGLGSMHSIGGAETRDRDGWEPGQEAYLDGHHTEYPQSWVVPKSSAIAAAAEFVDAHGARPQSIQWELD